MRQELVFIGQDLDENAFKKKLEECLLSEKQVLSGKTYWETLEDPFPAWEKA